MLGIHSSKTKARATRASDPNWKKKHKEVVSQETDISGNAGYVWNEMDIEW